MVECEMQEMLIGIQDDEVRAGKHTCSLAIYLFI